MRSSMRGVTLFSLSKRPDQMAIARAAYAKTAAEMRESVRAMEAGQLNATDRTASAAIRSALDQWVENFQEFADLCAQGRAEEATVITLKKTSSLMDALQKNAAELARVSRDRQENATARTLAAIKHTQLLNSVLMVLLLGAGVGAAGIVFSLTRTLSSIVTELSTGSHQINAAATQVASSSQSLAQGASEQAASLGETSSSTEEITSMMRKSSENSDSAAQAMILVDQHVKEGNRRVEQMVGSMRDITASSEKISKIVKSIDEIAFQTNILALNAAVEAARAGEAGLGFAVVADEVRNLAHRAAEAAKNTSDLIEDSIAKSNQGAARLQEVADVIRIITESAVGVKTQVDEVKASNQEQTHGIEQIAKAVAQMDQITQTTAATAEEGASASEELSAQANVLNDVALRLRTLVAGES
jgi:methyl-accepting chemotaxis protein/methyl-accepting chemotaxis protein-1 (serine sensor receptor)